MINNDTNFNNANKGVLITIVYYNDKTVFSMPGGKRMLGETSYNCIKKRNF